MRDLNEVFNEDLFYETALRIFLVLQVRRVRDDSARLDDRDRLNLVLE